MAKKSLQVSMFFTWDVCYLGAVHTCLDMFKSAT